LTAQSTQGIPVTGFLTSRVAIVDRGGRLMAALGGERDKIRKEGRGDANNKNLWKRRKKKK